MKPFCTVLIFLLVTMLAVPAHSYDNDGHDENGNKLYSGGPHRAINEMAVQEFIKRATDPVLRQYDFKRSTQLTGSKVTARGMEFITEGDGKGTVQWWITEGGYTADEPELYNSFRHFYDPLENDGVPYLTDHLDQLDYVYRAFVFGTRTGRIVRFVAGNTVNPQINARDWAISGGKGNSFWENQYCWNKGIDYMQQAFSATKGKDRLFVKAWRSLGETMHLLADMTSVPHVRNDSHPGIGVNWDYDPDQGFLKNDPYELLCTEGLVRASAGGSVDPVVRGRIDTSSRPEDLFHRVAVYTSSHFFTADTIAGTYVKNKGTPQEQTITVGPANGKPVYTLPRLAECDYDEQTGYFSKSINGRAVRLLHENWTSSAGWASSKSSSGYTIPLACVRDQAAVLIPVAVHGNVRLIDLFMPRIEVQITDIDTAKRELHGKIVHRPYGAFSRPLEYSGSQSQFFNFYLDNRLQNWDKFDIEIKANKITLGFKEGFELGGATKLALELDIGGLMIRSQDFSLGGTISGLVCLRKEEIPPAELNNPYTVLQGKPVPDLQVTCSYATPKGTVRQTAVTDKRGFYSFAVPFDTEVTLMARGESKKATCTLKKPRAGVNFGWQGHEIQPGVIDPSMVPVPIPNP